MFKSFRPPFSKGGEVKGEEPLAPSAEGEIPHFSLQKILILRKKKTWKTWNNAFMTKIKSKFLKAWRQ